jgi:glutamate racemase
VLGQQGTPCSASGDRTRYCVTGSAQAFALAATPWLGGTPAVQSVCLQSQARIP